MALGTSCGDAQSSSGELDLLREVDKDQEPSGDWTQHVVLQGKEGRDGGHGEVLRLRGPKGGSEPPVPPTLW